MSGGVKYHGEFPEGQVDDKGKPFIEQHGYVFHAGESVTVDDKGLLNKFSGNRFFEVSGKSDKDSLSQGKVDAEQAETETLRAWLTDHQVPFHHKTGLEKLRAAKADWLKAQDQAQED